MDKATQTMINNLSKNTGKNLDQWIELVRKESFSKHGDILKFLKDKHNLTHGYANLIALKSRSTDSGSAENPDDLVKKQFVGKEHFKSLYDTLIYQINKFGSDIEISPKNKYVSLRRKKQFATLQPASKTRFEIGLIIKGEKAKGKLEQITSTNSMCSHKIVLSGEKDINKEVIDWLKSAYEKAG